MRATLSQIATRPAIWCRQWRRRRRWNQQVDGGMVANDWLLQFSSDIIDVPVERPKGYRNHCAGAAYLAGLQQGIFSSLEDISGHWRRRGAV